MVGKLTLNGETAVLLHTPNDTLCRNEEKTPSQLNIYFGLAATHIFESEFHFLLVLQGKRDWCGSCHICRGHLLW